MKSGFIEVHDNVIPVNLQNYLNYLTEAEDIWPIFKWKFVRGLTNDNYASKEEENYDVGFNHNFLKLDNKSQDSFYKDCFYQILYQFCFYRKINLTRIWQCRAFLTLPPPISFTQPPHVDMLDPHWVCLYYMNDSDGDTVFYKEDKKTEIKRISPKPGRIAFFDGSIPHSGTLPIKNERKIVNFNFSGLI